MSGKPYLLLILLLLLLPLSAMAQATKVKGRVTDVSSGEGIPFAGIYFKNTMIGVSTDLDGYYSLETRDPAAQILCATILGYETQEKPVKQGAFSQIDFKLKSTENTLNAIIIKPDNRRMKRILRLIDENRHRNDPERRENYQCDIYNKMELDLTNADERIRNRLIRKNFGFIFNYMDTSVVSGQPYLPVMISETKARRYHRGSPPIDKEVIEGSRISGIRDENVISQFTGSMHLKTNFYGNFINAFNVEFPSPLSAAGNLYYDYYLIDSLNIEGRKTYMIRFHPGKLVSSPVFDGEMMIDADDFGMRSMHARMQKGGNVNWIRDLVIDIENQRIGDSTWFYRQSKLYVDFSVTMKDSSKVMSFLGHRQMFYSNPEFNRPLRKEIADAGDNVMVRRDAGKQDEQYWASARPYALSQKEQNIYNMVDSIKSIPLYRNLYSIVATFVNGYYDTRYIGFGPYHKVISFNPLEGLRMQLGGRTTPIVSEKIRLMLYGAYGTLDRSLKGGGTVELMFNKQPTRKLTLSGKKDILQLGRGTNRFTEGNIMSSLMSKSGSQKPCPVTEFSLMYEHEWNPNFNNTLNLEHMRIHSNHFVPMVRPDGTAIKGIGVSQIQYSARFSWDETVTRGIFIKKYIHTKYPVVTFDFKGALKGFMGNDYSFFRPEITINYRLPLPPAGHSRIQLNAGKIFGQVPYPLLKLHEGNGTYFLDRSTFACMNYFEFASDTWATLFLEHNFNGFFLGKIPLLRKMQLREVYSLKAAYGTLSEQNRGIIGDPAADGAALLFPAGMSSLEKPYVEMGVGITNILRVFRIDAFWRTTHRHYTDSKGVRHKAPNRFALNFGIQLSF